jgi:hypothetical protein
VWRRRRKNRVRQMVVFAGRGDALRSVWDGESDHWLSPLSIKPSQGLIDIQDEVRGVELSMSPVPCEFTV